MSKLEDKLEEIVVGFASDGNDEVNVYIPRDAVPEIKQAFMDAGWVDIAYTPQHLLDSYEAAKKVVGIYRE